MSETEKQLEHEPQNEPEHDADDEPPTTRRPTWLSDAMLTKTSPVVPWNNETLAETRKLNDRLALVRNHNSYTKSRMTSLEKEMDDAWQNYALPPKV